jgi:RNA polymerase sigma factor (sigma-70 family)
LTQSLSPEEEYRSIMQVRQQPEAIRPLYRHYFPRIFAYVMVRVGSRQDAEDLTADIFMKVVEAIHQFEYRGEGSFAAWIFQIAHNTVRQFYRVDERWETTLIDALPELHSTDPLPEEVFSRKERLQWLQAALESLTPRRREIVLLRFAGGLRNQEIAHTLDLDERTVASHLCRALEDLQQQYQREELADESE